MAWPDCGRRRDKACYSVTLSNRSDTAERSGVSPNFSLVLPAALPLPCCQEKGGLRFGLSSKSQPGLLTALQTGTLTEDGLDLWGVVPVVGGGHGGGGAGESARPALADPVKEPRSLGDTHPLLCAMAACHSLTRIDGDLAGDPLDVKVRGVMAAAESYAGLLPLAATFRHCSFVSSVDVRVDGLGAGGARRARLLQVRPTGAVPRASARAAAAGLRPQRGEAVSALCATLNE